MKPFIALPAILLSCATALQAQSPDEIMAGAAELSDRLDEARSEGNADKTCTMVPVIEAERLAVLRLMAFRLDETFEHVEDSGDQSKLGEIGEELGRYIGVTNVLSRLLGRAELACEYLSAAPETDG